MSTNVGRVDRILRLIIGVFLIVAPLINSFGLGGNAVVAYGMMIVGAILSLTAVVGFCPLYSLLGIKTTAH